MNINRNNYEEYFLLYADNELSKTERKVVEIFVQENPDLKEEFSMWKLTINSPDEEVKLTDKSFLIKEEPSSFINENNYEEIFVLYHDNELNDTEKNETEKFIAGNSKFKPEFELIGKAKLVPESSVIFPAKKQLYKKDRQGKVISMILWRSIAAAVIIGFGLWITISYLNRSRIPQTAVTTTNNSVQKSSIKTIKTETGSKNEKRGKEKNNIASSTNTSVPEKIRKNKTSVEKPVLNKQKIKEKSIVSNDTKTKTEFVEQKINTSKPDTAYQLTALEKPVIKLPAIEETGALLKDDHIALSANKAGADAHNKVNMQTASYISDNGDNNQNYVFYDMPAENFRKSKVGVFLKKVRRVVERNNPITRLFAEEEDQVAAK